MGKFCVIDFYIIKSDGFLQCHVEPWRQISTTDGAKYGASLTLRKPAAFGQFLIPLWIKW